MNLFICIKCTEDLQCSLVVAFMGYAHYTGPNLHSILFLNMSFNRD